MNNERVIWKPNPGPQTEFLACPAREVLYGGSAGAGKTDGLLIAGATQTGNPAHRAIIFRRSFPMLRDLIERSHELFVPLGAQFNKQSSQWRFPSGALLEFGFLDADEDRYRYFGRAFSFIGWDELTTWPIDSNYIFLMSRLRAIAESGLRLEVRATCTPNGVGVQWVKQRFNIGNDDGKSEVIDEATGLRRVFIPARISDNPFLAGGAYEQTLRALPEASRKALLHGRWDVYEGAVFNEWDYGRHTCHPFPIPATWDIWRACDDGFAAPACVLWLAHDRDITDTVYVIEEVYRNRMTPDIMAVEILRRDRSIQMDIGGDVIDNDMPLDGVIDSASFADVGMGGGRAQVMNSLGCNWEPAEKGPGSRLAGISAIHSRLALRNDGSSGLIIFRSCKNLIRTLPALCYDTAHPEDYDTDAEDHCVDALRYGLTRRERWFRRVRVKGI
jgi:hypothetical protein